MAANGTVTAHNGVRRRIQTAGGSCSDVLPQVKLEGPVHLNNGGSNVNRHSRLTTDFPPTTLLIQLCIAVTPGGHMAVCLVSQSS